MVLVIRRKKGKGYFHYLVHDSGKQQYEKYVGKKMPEDIEQRKRDFLLEISRKKWKESLDVIHSEYLKQPKSILEKNLEEFSYKFTHDSQKIEGSTLTEKDTFNLLRFSLTPNQKSESDMLETKLHHQVYLKMIESLPKLSQKTVLQWHKEMFKETKAEFAGIIRTYPVYVTNSNSVFLHEKFVPSFLKEFFTWYDKSIKIIEPVELAGLTHFRFANIHPFGDGNGRTSRLLMNYVLIKNNYPPLNIKYSDRHPYNKSLEKGNLQHDEFYFLKWFIKYYIKSNKRYL